MAQRDYFTVIFLALCTNDLGTDTKAKSLFLKSLALSLDLFKSNINFYTVIYMSL